MAVKLLELLDSLALRTSMYVQPVSFATVEAYLHGLAAGLEHAGIKHTWEEYQAAAESRGWDPRGSTGIVRDFNRKGLSDAEMIEELVAIKADAYRRALARLGKSG